VQCSMVTQPLDTLIVALRSDDLDAAVLPLPVNDPELELTKLGSCSLIAAFAARLPLAAKPRLRLRDLNDQPIVALPDYPANLYSWILPYLKKRRIRFNPVRGAFDLTTLLLMAASGLGIALVPGSYRQCGPPGLVYREITDSTLDLSVALAWKKGTLTRWYRTLCASCAVCVWGSSFLAERKQMAPLRPRCTVSVQLKRLARSGF
jgi:DNA-binding transcriptional LysR family regulator